ncbi:MAG TPA: Lrp/AsnC family transcriptional regulator [Pseudonocardiaceae bacterium]|nr:Lrp/AsnC family transcriptional regulator [Pseudonocardiaceae bacterium]
MDSLPLDDLDRRIVHGLAVAGRAPLSRIAAALDVSDRTVAHRYRRLRAAGLRVVGVVDGRRLGWVEWLVRMRCAPDAAPAVAEALARRDDTAWVGLAAGGTEITCVTRSRDSPLLAKLARTPRIHTITAQCLLRAVAGTAGWHGRTDALDPGQIERIRGPRTVPTGPVRITDADRPLLRALAVDGRTGYPALSSATGRSQSTVRRRLAELLGGGALYLDVDVDPALLGHTCQAMLWLTVAPTELTSVTAALAEHREIAYAAATTGATNVAAFAVCRDLDALYDYLTTRIGALPGVLQVETTPITELVKRAGARVPPGAGMAESTDRWMGSAGRFHRRPG